MVRKNRPSLNLLLDKKNLVGVEIGIQAGLNAEWMLENLDIKKLYLIDPYEEYPNNNKKQTIHPASPINKEDAIQRLTKYKDKFEFIYKFSWDAIDDIPDQSLDFVYIDGDHRKEAAYKDMQYYKKLKFGGLLCGHDWRFSSIQATVKDFVRDMRVTFICCDSEQYMKVIDKHADDCDWWIQMPKKEQVFDKKCNRCQRITSIVAEKINWLTK